MEKINLSEKVFNPIKELVYQDGSVVSKTIVKKTEGNVSVFAFAKGEALSEHAAPFDALVQVIEGVGEIIINGKSYLLNQGDMILIPANIPHAVKAPENFKMVLTMIKTVGEKISVIR